MGLDPFDGMWSEAEEHLRLISSTKFTNSHQKNTLKELYQTVIPQLSVITWLRADMCCRLIVILGILLKVNSGSYT